MRVGFLSTFVATLALSYTCDGSNLSKSGSLSKREVVAGGTTLRILPLGDSITVGIQSSDSNGYRVGLQKNLAGSKLQFVGDLRNGTMSNDHNAGYSGYTINQISSAADHSITTYKPNIILLHAGTNDVSRGDNTPDPVSGAPDRLGQLIDKCVSRNQDAAIIVAQIINAKDGATESKIQAFNKAVPGVVKQRADDGHHVMVVDMSSITTSDLADDLHPSDAGYRKMADLWLNAIKDVDAKGWIKEPTGPDPDTESSKAQSGGCLKRRDTPRSTCNDVPIWRNPAPDGGLIASGVAKGGDAKFLSDWQPQGRVALGINKNGSNVRFADFNGDGRADYLWVDEDNGSVIAYLNTGNGNSISWAPQNDGNPIASGVGKGAGVHFANMGGQNQVDYLFIDRDNGAVHLYENKGADDNYPGKWKWVGAPINASGAPGADHWNVKFADLNGDGRDDYMVVGDHGSLDLYLNTGSPGAVKPLWEPSGQVATGVGKDFTLADIDGDGRADYLTWAAKGGLGGYLNVRDRKEAVPKWIDQGGDTSIALGVGVDWQLCRLADFTGNGKADYAVIDVRNGGFDLYINNGHADTSVPGDAIFLVDLDGDGLDDYVSMDKDGKIIAYLNGGPDSGSFLGWSWIQQNKGNPIALGVGARRDQIRLANIYGHGRADYLVIDDETGAVTAWENEGSDDLAIGSWRWTSRGQIASGIGKEAGVRFADYDGDGRDDYIWLSEKGEAKIYINYVEDIPENWKGLNDGKYVALGVGARREDVRLADLDGDGRADYIWVHAFDGSIDVWRNAFNRGPGTWDPYDKKLALGVGAAGANVHFARINGDRTGRADYVVVEPSSGGLRLWINGCEKLAPGSVSSNPAGSSSSDGSSDCEEPDITSPSGNGPSSNDNGSNNGSPSNDGLPLIVVAGTTYTANSKTEVILDGKTLTPGGQVVAGGTTISLSSDASLVVVAGSTQPLGAANPTPRPPPVFTVGPSTFTADSATRVVIEGQTLSPGGGITVDGTSIELPPDATAIVVGGTTKPPIPPPSNAGPSLPRPSPAGSEGNGPSPPEVTPFPLPCGAISTDLNECGTSVTPGSGDGITIPGFTTIASTPKLGNLPKSGQDAISALAGISDVFLGGLYGLRGLFSSLSRDGGRGGNSGGGLSSGAVSNAAAALTDVIESGESLLNGMNAFKMSSFSEGATDLVSDINSAKFGLRNLLDLLRPVAREFARFIKDPPSGLTDYKKITTYVAGAVGTSGLAVGIREIFREPIVATSSSSRSQSAGVDGASKTATSTSSSSSPSGTPREWLLCTVRGTSESAFETFVSNLPDKGTGRRTKPAFLKFQYYVGKMTLEEARFVSKDPIVDQLVSNEPMEVNLPKARIPETSPNPHHRRVTPVVIESRYNTFHLRVISLPKPDSIAGLYQDAIAGQLSDRTNFYYDGTPGEQTWLYIMDTGFAFDSGQFIYSRGVGSIHAMPWAGSADDDWDNHGTCVASMAVGAGVGTYPEANYIGVKVLPEPVPGVRPKLSAEEVTKSWIYVFDDVINNNRQGKTVINWSITSPWDDSIDNNGHFDYGDINLPVGRFSDAWFPILREAWELDIVTICSGNNNPLEPLGDRSPQRYGRFNNALITVDSMNFDGSPWPGASPTGPPSDGRDRHLTGWIDLVADSVGVICSEKDGELRPRSGASFAAPQVVGIAANWLASPNQQPFTPGQVSMEMKARLVALSRSPAVGSPDGYSCAYNGVRELFCAAGLPPKVKARKDASSNEVPYKDALSPITRRQEITSLLPTKKIPISILPTNSDNSPPVDFSDEPTPEPKPTTTTSRDLAAQPTTGFEVTNFDDLGFTCQP